VWLDSRRRWIRDHWWAAILGLKNNVWLELLLIMLWWGTWTLMSRQWRSWLVWRCLDRFKLVYSCLKLRQEAWSGAYSRLRRWIVFLPVKTWYLIFNRGQVIITLRIVIGLKLSNGWGSSLVDLFAFTLRAQLWLWNAWDVWLSVAWFLNRHPWVVTPLTSCSVKVVNLSDLWALGVERVFLRQLWCSWLITSKLCDSFFLLLLEVRF